MFLNFLKQGLCVVPLKEGKPQTSWSSFYDSLPTEEEAKAWDKAGYDEYALLCGGASGVIGLDIDTDDTETIYAIAGHTPLRKRGSKGFTAFYKYNGERSQSWAKAGQNICEILSDRRLTTIPPSKHRKTGKKYVWLEGDSFAKLPAINPDIFLFLDAKFPKAKQKIWTPPPEYNEPVELHQAAEMLDYISSDCPRDDWIKIGMALRHEFGDMACTLWHQWSARAGVRYNHADAQAAWRSFNNDGVTIGTIVYLAKRNGYIKMRTEPKNFSVDISYVTQKKKEDRPANIKVNGLVGQIADWITESAISPQPALSLSAAISFMGMLKAGRVCHKIRGARTNMMCISMAPTGSGKDWPQDAIDHLGIELGLEKHLMSRPTSGTALLRGLEKGGGISLLKIDEVGRYMGHITNKNAQSFQAEIGDYMIELFSSATKTFRGKQFADEKANPTIIIKNPHLCCIGSSVPERFRDACKSSAVIDGFLNRWIIFSSQTWPERDFTNSQQVSPILLENIKLWMAENELQVDSYGNVGKPKIVAFTPEAYDVFKDFENEQHNLVKTVPHPYNNMYVRNGEHVVKLSLVLADDGIIGIGEVETAIAIIQQSIAHSMDFAKSITDNDHEARVMYVLDVIKAHGTISRENLTYKTRKLSNRDRRDVVDQLIESGEVLAEKDGKKVTLKIAQ